MNIHLEDAAKDALIKALKEQNKSAVRLSIAGFGWGGPNLSVVLDEQKENDTLVNVEGIDFVANQDEEFVFEDCTVSYKKTFFGETFKVVSKAFGESSCS